MEEIVEVQEGVKEVEKGVVITGEKAVVADEKAMGLKRCRVVVAEEEGLFFEREIVCAQTEAVV